MAVQVAASLRVAVGSAADPGPDGAVRPEALQHRGGHGGDPGRRQAAGEDPDHGDPEPACEGGGVRGQRTHRHQGRGHREAATAGQHRAL